MSAENGSYIDRLRHNLESSSYIPTKKGLLLGAGYFIAAGIAFSELSKKIGDSISTDVNDPLAMAAKSATIVFGVIVTGLGVEPFMTLIHRLSGKNFFVRTEHQNNLL